MTNCTNNDLILFSHEHYTYINQIFGDEAVRETIKEIYPGRDWEFAVEPANSDFDENSDHHVLVKTGKDGKQIKWCSSTENFQNTNININDTLCQSYTLMKYLNKPIDKNMKTRQMDMIEMYRQIIKKTKFKTEFSGMVELMQKHLIKSFNLEKI